MYEMLDTVTDPKIQISEEDQDAAWDEFVAGAPGGHHVQTSLWGQVKATLGWRAKRIIVTDQEQIIGGQQVLCRHIPLIGGIGYVVGGPLVQHDDPDLIESLLHELLEFSKSHHLRYVVVQPPHGGESIAKPLSLLGFKASATELMPTASILIDSTADLCDILAHMKRQTRQNIMRGERQGITVREGAKDDLPTFYDLTKATCARQDAIPFPQEYFLKMWDVLEPAGYLRMFVAEYQGQAVSALLVAPFGQTVVAKVLGWSGLHPDRRPNEAVFWAAIRWSKSQGYRCFDFDGVDPSGARCVLNGEPLPEPLRKTPDFFKYGFGGQVVLYPQAYQYIPNPLLRWGYSQLFTRQGSRKLFLKTFDIIRKRR